ncbi:MAG: hypothetical protein FWD01_04055 [Defluviitaleaceae bacterium]|nr:hypothetical protein [Defluviitaleaceae bacterium]
MDVKKKRNIMPGIIVLLLGLIVITGILFYGYYVTSTTHTPFYSNRTNQGQQLYNETLGRDMVVNYPQSPEELMNLYNAATFFLYGNIIADEQMIADVIDFQRLMLSHEIVTTNSPTEQLRNIREAVDFLNDAGITVRRPEVMAVRFDLHSNRIAIANIRQIMVFNDNLYWVYFLELDDNDQWKIVSWSQTDDTFTLQIEENQ